MKLLIVVASLVVLVKASPFSLRTQSHASPDYLNFKCDGLENGFYADRLRGCHQYYRCMDGVKETYFCKERDTLFSEDTWACISMATYSCPALEKRVENVELDLKSLAHGPPSYMNFKCEGREDGMYPDLLRGCKQYYSCRSGVKGTHICKGQGQIFSQDLYACVPATTYSCPAMEKRTLEVELVKKTPSHGVPDYLNFDCEGREDGYYADLLRGCHQYYFCKGGEKSTYFCQDHQTIFSEQMRACVFQTTYSCPSLKKRLLEEVQGKHPDRPDDLDFKCENRKDGYYADNERNCHVFYYCKNGEKFQFSCPSGTLFDASHSVCNWAKEVFCESTDKREADCVDDGIKAMEHSDDILKRLRQLLKELKERKMKE